MDKMHGAQFLCFQSDNNLYAQDFDGVYSLPNMYHINIIVEQSPVVLHVFNSSNNVNAKIMCLFAN